MLQYANLRTTTYLGTKRSPYAHSTNLKIQISKMPPARAYQPVTRYDLVKIKQVAGEGGGRAVKEVDDKGVLYTSFFRTVREYIYRLLHRLRQPLLAPCFPGGQRSLV